jgi:hypothetical protein
MSLLFKKLKVVNNVKRRVVDKNMFFCFECKRLYEWSSLKNSFIYYAKGSLPTYGKAKQTCEECK